MDIADVLLGKPLTGRLSTRNYLASGHFGPLAMSCATGVCGVISAGMAAHACLVIAHVHMCAQIRGGPPAVTKLCH